MADDPIYLVPHRTGPRIFRSLSSYLQEVACYGPPLASASLPTKLVTAKAAEKKASEKKASEEKKKKEQQWIEIELVGEDGKRLPVSYRYVLEFPDGTKREGLLRDGKVRYADPVLEPGQSCKLTFPDLDMEYWE